MNDMSRKNLKALLGLEILYLFFCYGTIESGGGMGGAIASAFSEIIAFGIGLVIAAYVAILGFIFLGKPKKIEKLHSGLLEWVTGLLAIFTVVTMFNIEQSIDMVLRIVYYVVFHIPLKIGNPLIGALFICVICLIVVGVYTLLRLIFGKNSSDFSP